MSTTRRVSIKVIITALLSFGMMWLGAPLEASRDNVRDLIIESHVCTKHTWTRLKSTPAQSKSPLTDARHAVTCLEGVELRKLD